MNFEKGEESMKQPNHGKDKAVTINIDSLEEDIDVALEGVELNNVKIDEKNIDNYATASAERVYTQKVENEKNSRAFDNAAAIIRTKSKIEGWNSDIVTQTINFVNIHKDTLITTKMSTVERTEKWVDVMMQRASTLQAEQENDN